MNNKDLFISFKNKLMEIHRLQSAVGLLHWDMQTYMPPAGARERSDTIATLAALIHDKFTSVKFEKELKTLRQKQDLNAREKSIINEVWRDFSRQKKLPRDFVKELARASSEGHAIWVEARKKSNFKLFQPQLEKLIQLKRKEAQLVGFKESPYDALIDVFEPRMTAAELSPIFYELREFLVPLVKKIRSSKVKPKKSLIRGDFPIAEQKKFSEKVIAKIGFNLERGRLDTAVHPFCIQFHPHDVRITTRYNTEDLLYCLTSVIHEAGHALYEQGILPENFGTPLGESISLGVHESQSRLWENIVGRSIPFWQFFYPLLQKTFPTPFSKVSLRYFYQVVNSVKSSFIRTEADEVTYNLHIILRFEIEKELIEGSIEVKDLPKIWNAKVKELLGLNVPNDAKGVLQDVHWSEGLFGYFPTYTLGNLYAAQFYEAAKRDIPKLEERISRGHFQPLLKWLRENIHIHGKFYSADELVRKVTGKPLTAEPFIKYIKSKYSKIYRI